MAMRTFKSEDVEPAAAAIGFFVINWTLVESVLDVWQSIIFMNANGSSFRKRMELMLGPKLEFLRDNFRDNPLLEQYAVQCDTILTEVERISETRHTILHDHISRFDPDTNILEFSDLKLLGRRVEYIHIEKTLPVQRILDDGIKCENLHPRMVAVANNLVDRFVP